MASSESTSPHLEIKEYHIATLDDTTTIPIHLISSSAASLTTAHALRPAIIHAHGGAFIKRNPTSSRFHIRALPPGWLAKTGIVLVYVGYRVASEAPFPASYEDVLAALKWVVEKGESEGLGVDGDRVGVMGISAGGNLALCAAVRASNESALGLASKVTALMLVYPMLDPDTTWPAFSDTDPKAVAEKAFLRRGWDTYLRNLENLNEEQRKFARPWTLTFKNLPSTYLDVGTRDYFYEEVGTLRVCLESDGVSVQWREWEGMEHGFERAVDAKDELEGGYARIVREAWGARLAFWEYVFGLDRVASL